MGRAEQPSPVWLKSSTTRDRGCASRIWMIRRRGQRAPRSRARCWRRVPGKGCWRFFVTAAAASDQAEGKRPGSDQSEEQTSSSTIHDFLQSLREKRVVRSLSVIIQSLYLRYLH